MRYLIGGGAGFLGSHLCDYLIDRGDKVVCIDNYITGSINNIKHLLSNSNFDWLEWDITNYLDVKKVDGIFNLASPTDPIICKEKTVETLEANVQGTSNLLRLSKNLNVPLLFTSSIRIMDKNSNGPYIEGKRTGELLCNEYGSKIARMGNVYGPRMDKNDGRVIPTFLRKALANENITIWSDGSQIDSFCYVSDIVDGLCKFMDSSHSGVIEFGSAELITISDLANLIITECNSKSSVSFTKDKVDPSRKVVDISKAKELFGWDPKINLKEGINYVIRCILKNKI